MPDVETSKTDSFCIAKRIWAFIDSGTTRSRRCQSFFHAFQRISGWRWQPLLETINWYFCVPIIGATVLFFGGGGGGGGCGSRPGCGAASSDARRRCGRRCRCRAALRAISPACAGRLKIDSDCAAPHDHLIPVPHACVTKPTNGSIDSAGCRPTIGAWVVPAAGVQDVAVIVSAPHDHLVSSPDRRMLDSR